MTSVELGAPKRASNVGVMNCYSCGRFARATMRRAYYGWPDPVLLVTTHCASCGDIEVSEA